MNIRKAPALVLAVALQTLPLCRVACIESAAAPTGFAIVMRWLAGAVALLGSYHAVSGASAAISGIAPYSAVGGSQTGPVSLSASGTVGKPFVYRIIVTNPGSDHQQDFWNAFPLPPGLTINTNIGGNGYITGTPTVGGVSFPVTLLAGNQNCSCFVTKSNVTITISGGSSSPPQITGPPTNQTVSTGANVSFSVTATGTAPLSYLWKFNGAPIPGATTSALQLPNVQTSNSGPYSVTVTNSAGSVTSLVATLTVLIPPSIITPPQSLTVTNGHDANFSVVAAGSAPLHYQWKFNGTDLAGATTSSLTLPNAQLSNQGDYTVMITNAVAAELSPVAHLAVESAPTSPFQLGNWQAGAGLVSFDVAAPSPTKVVIWSSTDLAHWTALSTNFNSSGTVHFSETNATETVEFYRATLSP